MRAVPVVVVKPARKVGGAFFGRVVSGRVSPLAQSGLNESLGFAIGTWRVRPSTDVFDFVALTSRTESPGLVARPIVGEQTTHVNPEARVPGQSRFEKSRCRNSFFVGSDLRESDPGVIVDGHVNILPSSISNVLIAVAVNAVADTAEAAEFLDVQMQQIAWTRVLVAIGRR